MSPNGNTNQTIGFAWGWQSADGRRSHECRDAAGPDAARHHSAQRRRQHPEPLDAEFQSSIDAREKAACDNAKAEGVLIYTVFVDLNGTSGSSAALEYCASDSSKYFDLTSSGQIVTAFNTIGQQITNLRIAR